MMKSRGAHQPPSTLPPGSLRAAPACATAAWLSLANGLDAHLDAAESGANGASYAAPAAPNEHAKPPTSSPAIEALRDKADPDVAMDEALAGKTLRGTPPRSRSNNSASRTRVTARSAWRRGARAGRPRCSATATTMRSPTAAASSTMVYRVREKPNNWVAMTVPSE